MGFNPLYVANIIEYRFTGTEPANVEKSFHSGQISAAKLNLRQQAYSATIVSIVAVNINNVLGDFDAIIELIGLCCHRDQTSDKT